MNRFHPLSPTPLSAPAKQKAQLLLMDLKRAEREITNLIQQGHNAPIEARFRDAMAAANGKAAQLSRDLDPTPAPAPGSAA